LLSSGNSSASTGQFLQTEVTGIEIVDYGVIGIMSEKIMVDAPDTATGKKTGLKKADIKETTDEIPAKVGIAFGVTYIVHGKPRKADIKILVKRFHPRFTNPKSQKSYTAEQSTWNREIGKVTMNGFHFAEEWEVVPGEWIFQFWYEGRKLAEKIFTVYKP